MINADNNAYFHFTGPMRLDKAMHTLEGIVRGIAMDGKVLPAEVAALSAWLDEYDEVARYHPFCEFATTIGTIIADGVIDEDEKADMLWLMARLGRHNEFYDDITSDMQRLQGLMGGIAADGLINEFELQGLQNWVNDHTHLRTRWPYDELDALLVAVLRDGRIDSQEHQALLAFFREFADLPGSGAGASPSAGPPLLSGVCAACPEIEFTDRCFCFTGKSARMTRNDLARQVVDLGGRFSAQVRPTVHYLVVGADGNPCWAYACYGRKVEQAIAYRRQGLPLILVHENDYWDAVQDRGLTSR